MTATWGVPAWKFLHAITDSYPESPSEQNKRDMQTFFISLKNVLPCTKCQVNYADHLKRLPLTDDVLSSRQNLSQWLIDIHNMVNVATGKKVWKKGNDSNTWFSLINIIILTIIAMLFVAVCISVKRLVVERGQTPL